MATTKFTSASKDINVSYEDQMRICLFARKNSRLVDIQEQLSRKEKELQNLEDAGDELMLADDDQPIPYQIGEVFLHLNGDQTQELLEKTKTAIQKHMETLKGEAKDIERVLAELKVQLYAKFGTSINLESD